MNKTVKVTLGDVRTLAHDVLIGAGYGEDHTRSIADMLYTCQLDDCQSHGLFRLFMCIQTIKAGKIDGEIRVSRRRPRTVVEYSDKSNDNYIGISSNGRIEFRKKDQTTPTFVINPVTGVLHELETDTIARLEH